MSKRSYAFAFGVGLAVLAWVGLGFVGSSWLALAMTCVIAAVYLLGAFELKQFRAATTALDTALRELARPPAALADWLERVPATLRNTVRLRVEGERVALPGPALTPYLVGLLVMLGMLGTFLGMVVTFKGAVFALEGSTDLSAIRAALAAPIKGLGLSFGTSVAGVAASAMLGLMATISRRERLDVARQLDTRVATVLLPFSLTHQRQEAYRALQAQAQVLPKLVDTLQGLMERIEQRSDALDRQLLERQVQFQREVTQAYGSLAERVGASLQESAGASAKAAGDTIRPLVEEAMARIVAESQGVQQRVADIARQQVAEHGARMGEFASVWRAEFAALREQEEGRGAAAVERLGALQATVTQHLATLGAALEAPITRMLQTASEVPQAAAGVITELRAEMQRIGERDNLALQERTVLLEQFATLLDALQQASGEQRAAIDALVASAASVLQEAGARFGEALQAQAGQGAEMAAHVTASAVELASVADAFGASVQQFQASNDKLAASLQAIEASIARSTARSDEQLAYYVAQAREVIDLSIASQQGLVENLRQLQARPAKALALADEAGA